MVLSIVKQLMPVSQTNFFIHQKSHYSNINGSRGVI